MRTTRLAAAVAAIAFVGSNAALADSVYNDIDATVDATLESMVMDVGDVESVGLYIRVENAAAEGGSDSGGVSGCNLQGGRRLVLDIGNTNGGAASVVADTSSRFGSDPSKVLFTGDCEAGDPKVSILKATLTVTGVAATAVGTPAVVSFTKDSTNSTALGNWNLAPASFDVTVVGTAPAPTRDAPAIANTYLSDASDAYTDNCKAAQGTNKNRSNWHGQLISKVARQFEGQSFTVATVTAYVDSLCPSQ